MRAFVSIRNMRVERRPGPDGERRFYFLFDWVNTGNTPTKNMKTYVQFYLEDQPIPEDFDFSGPLGVKETGTAFIAPKVQYQVPTCPQWELHRRNCINMPLSGAGRLMKMYSLQPQFTLPGFAVWFRSMAILRLPIGQTGNGVWILPTQFLIKITAPMRNVAKRN